MSKNNLRSITIGYKAYIKFYYLILEISSQVAKKKLFFKFFQKKNAKKMEKYHSYTNSSIIKILFSKGFTFF